MAKLRLITLGPSHYCEKARWALDRAKANYVEERHAPMLHFFATARYAKLIPREGESRWGNGSGRTLPILVTPHGVLRDSKVIIKHIDAWIEEPRRLRPHGRENEADALEQKFDETLGTQTRRWAYSWLLDDHERFVDVLGAGLGPFESLLFRKLAPRIRVAMKKAFRIDEGTRTRALERIVAVMNDVDAILADGRPFLLGDRFTSADLTFASLSAPALLPDEFGAHLSKITSVEKPMADAIYQLRETRSGSHALRMFRDHRRK
jgi:glutathione S-transferase